MPWEDIRTVSQIGVVGLLVLFIYLLASGRLRWEREWKAEQREREKAERDRDNWMRLALKGTEVSKHAVRILDKTSVPTGTEDDGT